MNFNVGSILKEMYCNEKSGVYVAVKWKEGIKEILDKIKDSKIPNLLDEEKLHTTLAYSRKFFNYKHDKQIHEGKIKDLTIFENNNLNHKALVLVLNSDSLTNRHNKIHEDKNASYDFDNYIPHITITYNVEDYCNLENEKSQLENIKNDLSYLIGMKVKGGVEYSESLNDNWD